MSFLTEEGRGLKICEKLHVWTTRYDQTEAFQVFFILHLQLV